LGVAAQRPAVVRKIGPLVVAGWNGANMLIVIVFQLRKLGFGAMQGGFSGDWSYQRA
jgi:hypothetical protein